MKEFYFKISSRVRVRARSEQEATRKFQEYMADVMEFPGMTPDSGIFMDLNDALEEWDSRMEIEVEDFDSSEEELTADDLRLNNQ